MTKVLYSATMSLDGYIAGPGGDLSWLAEHVGGPNPVADDLVAEIGALLVGARSFYGEDPNRGTDQEGAFGGAWSGPTYVLTHRPPATPVPGVTFVDGLDGGLAAAKAAAGERYVNIIGADVAAQCLAAGLLDEILVFIAPVSIWFMREREGRRRLLGLSSAAIIALAGCGAGEQPTHPAPSPSPGERLTETEATPTPGAPATSGRPDWLGTRVLPERADGLGEVKETPAELVDRRFPPADPQPVADGFAADVAPVPPEVVARSTWQPECPVRLADLRYLTITFWGFDDRTHVGELIVHRTVADDVVSVFARIYAARFPIEEMRVVSAEELDAPPTGDGNNTSGFVCRPAALRSSWSEHAYGLAVDINPFHNPYRRGDAVVPELASAYLDRSRDLPGMIQPGDVVTGGFEEIGWGWGGDWNELDDWMHFSRSGR